MIFVRLFALALLLHENTGLFTQGRSYVLSCFVPAFGLTLPPAGIAAVHSSLIGLCLVLLVAPGLWPLYPLLFLVLTLLLASYSLRLSNHLVAGWFMCLLLCLDLLFQAPSLRGIAPTAFFLSGVQIIVGSVYALAFLHKLNSEFLSPAMSCGSFLGCDYAEKRVGIRHPRLLKVQSFLSIYGILGLEGLIPLLMLFPASRPVALLLAVLLHLPLALIGNAHFAGMMYAGLTAFVAPGDWPALLASTFALPKAGLVLYLLLGLFVGTRYGAYGHRRRLPSYLHQLVFCLYFLAALLVSLTLLHRGALHTFEWGGPLPRTMLLLVSAVFLVNGLGPYLGLKTNSSFAMFSNLRPLPWRHLLWRAEWRPFSLAHYVEIESLQGLPESALKEWGDVLKPALEKLEQPDQWLYTEYFFHEALRLIVRTAPITPVIRVTYTLNGQRHEVRDYAQEMTANPPRCLRLGLFPYALPRDPSVRLCE